MRVRVLFALATVATIVAGLASRRYAAALPWWLAKTTGDALYATMVVFGLAVLAPRAPLRWRGLGAIAFCFAIELSQLSTAPCLEALRATTLGGLVLGRGFHAFDLVCYVIGAAAAAGLELGAGVTRARARDRAGARAAAD